MLSGFYLFRVSCPKSQSSASTGWWILTKLLLCSPPGCHGRHYPGSVGSIGWQPPLSGGPAWCQRTQLPWSDTLNNLAAHPASSNNTPSCNRWLLCSWHRTSSGSWFQPLCDRPLAISACRFPILFLLEYSVPWWLIHSDKPANSSVLRSSRLHPGCSERTTACKESVCLQEVPLEHLWVYEWHWLKLAGLALQ